jgi:hypothetical protein
MRPSSTLATAKKHAKLREGDKPLGRAPFPTLMQLNSHTQSKKKQSVEEDMAASCSLANSNQIARKIRHKFPQFSFPFDALHLTLAIVECSPNVGWLEQKMTISVCAQENCLVAISVPKRLIEIVWNWFFRKNFFETSWKSSKNQQQHTLKTGNSRGRKTNTRV